MICTYPTTRGVPIPVKLSLPQFLCQSSALCYTLPAIFNLPDMDIAQKKPTHRYRTHTCNDLRADNAGETVKLSGWVHGRRDHGGVIFVDLRDHFGLTQVVLDPTSLPEAEKLRSEWVIQIEGTVRARPEGQANPNMTTGDIEVLATSLLILNSAETPPFEIESHGGEVAEEVRLEYRYLDLRRKTMQDSLKLRHKMINWSRNFFDQEGFLEIETPMMVKGTPEGSREYLVPSRLHPGEFYVLPQSPQQMKQLLMVSGFDKYVQFARCFRDEDQRGDRQPEFTQLDMEMSFVSQEDVMEIFERWILGLTRHAAPDKKILSEPIPVMSYQEAMDTYGSDKPDIRFDMKIQEATALLSGLGIQFLDAAMANGAIIKALVVPGGASFPRSVIDGYVDMAQKNKAKGLSWLAWDENGLRGSIAKFLEADRAAQIKEQLGAKDGDAVFFVAEAWENAVACLGVLRLDLGKRLGLMDENLFAYLWVTEFPMFEKGDDGSIGSVHHPFTRPLEEDFHLLETDKLKARSYTYDLVLNGVEIGGGSVRIHEQEMQKRIFELLGLKEEEIQRRFGHILKAFKYGVPPHAGCAMGIDRLVMIFAGQPTIREVMAFPKNQKARDLMFGAPTPMPDSSLHEANIEIYEHLE